MVKVQREVQECTTGFGTTGLSQCTLGIFSKTEQSGNIEKREEKVNFTPYMPVPVNAATDYLINHNFHSIGGTGLD